MENNRGFKRSQYACAVLLIVSSIGLVTYQVVKIDDVAAGVSTATGRRIHDAWAQRCLSL